MRLAPIILAVIGIWGTLYPNQFLEQGRGGGRWVFIIILILAVISFYVSYLKKKP